MKQFKDKEERKEESKWRTGVILWLGEDLKVYTNNNEKVFKGLIEHKCTEDEVVYMLQTALDEFKGERQARIVANEIENRATIKKKHRWIG